MITGTRGALVFLRGTPRPESHAHLCDLLPAPGQAVFNNQTNENSVTTALRALHVCLALPQVGFPYPILTEAWRRDAVTAHRAQRGRPAPQRSQGGSGAQARTKGQTREAKLAPTLQNTCPWQACRAPEAPTHCVSSPNSFRISRSMAIWGSSLVAQMVKNLPATQETWV